MAWCGAPTILLPDQQGACIKQGLIDDGSRHRRDFLDRVRAQPVFVVGVDERDVEISWPDMNDRHVLRARSADGQSSLLLTSCDLAHGVR